MSVATLPPNIQTKLDVLGRRLHRLRLLRGWSWLILVAVLGAGIALGFDAAFELPPAVRYLVTGVWVAAMAATAWRHLLWPLGSSVTTPGLAAAVEEEFPRLGERLTSAVELADADDTHGSPAFVRLLMREAEQKTRSLDFGRAAPPNAAEWLTAAGVAAVLVFAAPLVFIPDYYLGLGRRLLMPWDRRPAVMPFAIDLTPGDAFAARGRPLTIGVEFRPTRERAALPTACTLVMTGEDDKPVRLRMPTGGAAHTFAFRIDELKGNFRYHIEAGQIETEAHAVIAVDPVELAGGPITTLTPPAYAKTVSPQVVDGPIDLTVLEHGRVAIDCKFDRPAESATLIITPTAGADQTPQRRTLTLAEDHQTGRIELPARTGAKIRLELAAGHGITTLTPEQTLTVTSDRPPEFHRASGLPEQGSVRPTDALSLDMAVVDDLAVAAVEVEYRINDATVRHEPLALAGLGSPDAAGRAEFKLAGKAKDGDKLFVRLRAIDNRDVPEAKLGPNVVTYPAGDRWIELRVSADAASVRQQDVTAHRDDIDKRLRELIALVGRAVRRTYALHQDIDQGRASADEQTQKVRALTNDQADLSKKLEELAGDAAVAGLKPLADAMRAVGEQEFRQSAEALRIAGTTVDKGRVPPLRQADSALTDARKKLEALLQENRDLADARLAEVILNELADREKDLANQAKQELTAEEREKLAKEQEQIAEELKKLTENDDRLRDALQAARAEDAGKLAEEARKLAQAERDLDAKLAEAERQRNIAKLADLARKQQQLAADADRLSKQTESAAKTTQTPPLDAKPAEKAADDLKTGDADAAQQKQDQSARELDRIAEKLQQGIETAKDPREAAQQLAKLQDENRTRIDKATENARARQEQESIRKAVENLKLPEDNGAARRDRQQAAELAAEAARALNRDDKTNAEFRMGQAKEALERLAKDLPSVDDRRRRARDEVAKLRESQEGISRQAEKAAKAAEKGDKQAAADDRAGAARQQADIADRLSKLDAPGQEARRDRATKAAARAEDDLQNPASPDMAASQADARRTLERLAEALAGKTPADDKARELAKQERELAAAAAKATGDAAAQSDLKRRQEKVAQDTQNLKATEAPVRQGEATQAAIQANIALRDKPNEADTLQKMRAAADKLDALADQLAGRESEAERVDRLAKTQEAAAQKPPANPTEARRQANQVAGEMQQVRAGEQAAQAKQAATDALQRLQRTPPDSAENAQAQKDAAQALRKLADDMTRNAAATKPAPRPEDLARQQRELARETDAARQQPNDKQQLQKLADRQQQLRQQASRLPTDQAPKAVQQARQAMQQAEQSLAKQDAGDAAQRQQQAADALDKAARQMAQNAAAAQANQQPPDGMPSPGQVGQARDLAQRQRDLRDQVRQATAGETATADERAAANRQQQELARQAGDIAKSLDESAGAMPGGKAQENARGAAASARQGEQSLRQAQGNDPGQSKQARKQAAESLDRAAGQAAQAAKAGQGQPQPGTPQAGQQIQKAQGQMNQAQDQLGQGQQQQAKGAMQQAADALQEAAKQVGQQGEPQGPPRDGANQPAVTAAQGKGTPTAVDLPKELQKYAGKKWGELPGELRTRIVQDMKAQYGDDYGRIIKLYFEQIAENNGKK
jgi:hypothetical protein